MSPDSLIPTHPFWKQGELLQIYIESGCTNPVREAARDLVLDLKQCGIRTTITKLPPSSRRKPAGPAICIGTDNQPESGEEIRPLALGNLFGRHENEAFSIDHRAELPRTVWLLGACELGTQWAIYAFSRDYLGSDPFHHWTGIQPEPTCELRLPEIRRKEAPGGFRFRGWFLNDEDLLTEWVSGGGRRQFNYPYYRKVVHPAVMEKVVETALRNFCNLIIPASFLDIANPPEERLAAIAARRGLWLSQHHIEPLGASYFGLHNFLIRQGREGLRPFSPNELPSLPRLDATRPPGTGFPSFTREPQVYEAAWREYAGRWSRFPKVVWQLGLRGWGDNPIWQIDPFFPDDDVRRGSLLSKAMRMQVRILREVLGTDSFSRSTTLWAESGRLHLAGHLRFPAKTIAVMADNRRQQIPGFSKPVFAHRWDDDFHRVGRQSSLRFGVYAHPAFWSGGPHLFSLVPGEKIALSLREALESHCGEYAIFNVGNIKETHPSLHLTMEICWNPATEPDASFSRQAILRLVSPRRGVWYRDLGLASAPLLPGPAAEVPRLHDGMLDVQCEILLAWIEAWIEEASRTGVQDSSFRRPGADLGIRETLDGVAPKVRDGLARWRNLALRVRAAATRRKLPGKKERYFEAWWECQFVQAIAVHQFYLQLAAAVVLLVDRMSTQPAAGRLLVAAEMLEEAVAARERLCQPEWKNWYRGDRKFCIPKLAASARSTARDLLKIRGKAKSNDRYELDFQKTGKKIAASAPL